MDKHTTKDKKPTLTMDKHKKSKNNSMKLKNNKSLTISTYKSLENHLPVRKVYLHNEHPDKSNNFIPMQVIDGSSLFSMGRCHCLDKGY